MNTHWELLDHQVHPLDLSIRLGSKWGVHLELWPHALPQGSLKLACELRVSVRDNVLWEATMFEHVGEEQPSRLLGRGTFLGGNEVCHLTKSINHHHDHIEPPWWWQIHHEVHGHTLPEWVIVATTQLLSYWVLGFVSKSSKSSRILPHPLSSWANSKISWRMWWCALHHRGLQGAHHDIPSKAHPLTSLLEHRADFAYTTIVHFVSGSGTWSPFECLASFPWQTHHSSSQIKLPFGTQGIGHHVFLPRLVPNVHIEQGQCVLPSHLFWW